MRYRGAQIVLVVLALCPARSEKQQSAAQSTPVTVTYDDFLKLDAAQRVDLWGTMSPEDKSAIVRTHAERWLDRNRSRLTAGQTALVEEAIAFLTPELYRNPNDPEQVRREEALRAKLKCRLRRSDVMSAFKVVSPPAATSTWRDDLWAWLEGCVFG